MPRSFAALLGRYPDAVPDGDGYLIRCPSHRDRHPSLLLTLKDDGRLLIHCRAGCATSAVTAGLGIDRLDDWAPGGNVATTTGAPPAAVGQAHIAALRAYALSCHERLARHPQDTASQYLDDRFGIGPELAARFLLGLDPGADAESLRYRSSAYRAVPRLVVPFHGPDGVIRGAQGRDLTGTHRARWAGLSNPHGARWSTLAVFDHGTQLDTVLVTEGPGDALTAAAVGYDAVAIRGAALARTSAVVDELGDYLTDRRVVLCGDNDQAGRDFNATLGAALVAAGVQVHVLTIPDGNDLTDWRESTTAHFPDLLHRHVAEAPRFGTKAQPATTVADDDSYRLTDLGNAERLRDALVLVRHAPEVGFYVWDDATGWRLDRMEHVRATAHAVTRQMADEAAAMIGASDKTVSNAGKKLAVWAERSQSTQRLDAMIRELGAMPDVVIDVDGLDAHHHLLAFANGVVNLRSGDISPHDPALLMTRRLDIDYDPAAACPRWLRFLEEVFPDQPAMPSFMQRLIGYGITGETTEQCFAVLWGNGANGKSVLTDTLTEVFRAVTTTTPFATFEERPSGSIPNDLAALKGSRLVMASEGDRGRPMAESVIKRVTGRDLISARFMRREFFEYRPTFLILLATNHRPSFRGQDEGLWRRVKLIPFGRYFAPDERDHYLGERLLEEAAGIAAWAVRGAVDWYAHGLRDPATVTEATKGYRETSDALDGYWRTVLVPDPESRVVGADAYRAYTAWAEREGLDPHKEVWTRRTFYGALEERGVVRKRTDKGQTLMGVRLVTNAASSSETAQGDGRLGGLFR